MYDCPACGGNLKFDIPSQQLSCAFCNAFYDPYQITKGKDDIESLHIRFRWRRKGGTYDDSII